MKSLIASFTQNLLAPIEQPLGQQTSTGHLEKGGAIRVLTKVTSIIQESRFHIGRVSWMILR